MPVSDDARPLVLLNDTALGLPPGAVTLPKNARVVVAGNSLLRMTLADLALPGAQMIWTDFRQSASLSALHGTVQGAGGLDQLILAGDGSESETMFSLMCAILTFLPSLRRRKGARIVLRVEDGKAVGALRQFLQRLGPRLADDGITVDLHASTLKRLRTAA
jgi:hypothetical protein